MVKGCEMMKCSFLEQENDASIPLNCETAKTVDSHMFQQNLQGDDLNL